MKRLRIIQFFIPLALAGCFGSPERADVVTNKDFAVEVLFTDSDGYTMKRFADRGNYRYYATPGPTTVIGRSPGKNNTADAGSVTVP